MNKKKAALVSATLCLCALPLCRAAPTHVTHSSFSVSATVVYPTMVSRAPDGKIRCDGYQVVCKIKKKGDRVLVEY